MNTLSTHHYENLNKKTLEEEYQFQEDFLNDCASGRFERVKKVLDIAENKERVYIHQGEDYVMRHCYTKGFMNIVEYLIFDFNIDITKDIKLLMKDNPPLKHMFEMRELNKKLDQEIINTNKSTYKKI